MTNVFATILKLVRSTSVTVALHDDIGPLLFFITCLKCVHNGSGNSWSSGMLKASSWSEREPKSALTFLQKRAPVLRDSSLQDSFSRKIVSLQVSPQGTQGPWAKKLYPKTKIMINFSPTLFFHDE